MFEMTQARNQDLEEQGEEEEEGEEQEERKIIQRGEDDYEEERKRDGYIAEMEEAVEEMRSKEALVETRTARNRNFLETSSVSLKRSSQLVRSDALTPTSITRHLVMESEEMKRGIEEVGEVESEKRSRNNGIGVREQRETAENSRESRDCQTNLRETMRDGCPREAGGRRKSCTQSLDASSGVPPALETLPVRLMTKQESFSCSSFIPLIFSNLGGYP